MKLNKGFTRFLSLIICIIILCQTSVYSEEIYKISPEAFCNISPKGISPSFYMPYGMIFDKDGNIYITDSGNHQVQKLDSTGKKIMTWGQYGTADGLFNTPKGIALDNEKNVLIVDSGNNRIQKFAPDGKWIKTIGGFGKDNGEFTNPTGIATDYYGNIYVTDTGNSRVQKLSPNGKWSSFTGINGIADFESPSGISIDDHGDIYVSDLKSKCVYALLGDGNGELIWKGNSSDNSDWSICLYGGLYIVDSSGCTVNKVSFVNGVKVETKIDGSKNKKLSKPCGMAMREGKYYIADSGTNNIEIFDSSGNWHSRIGICSQFNSPLGIAADCSGKIYVADKNNHRIQKMYCDGTWIQSVEGAVYKNSMDMEPVSVAVDSLGYIYALDSANLMVHKYNQEGIPVLSWGSNGNGEYKFISPKGMVADFYDNIYVTDSVNNCIIKFTSEGRCISKFGSSGTENGQFLGISGIAVDNEGFIYVADTGNNRVQKLNSNGSWVATFGQKGIENQQFLSPEGIAVDINGYIYVCDTGNDRVQKLSPDGTWKETFGGSGIDDSKFYSPTGIAIGNHGQVYVSDTGNNRIQKTTSKLIIGDLNRDGEPWAPELSPLESKILYNTSFQHLNIDLNAADVNGDRIFDSTDFCYLSNFSLFKNYLDDIKKIEKMDLATKQFSVDVTIPAIECVAGSKIEIPITITGIPSAGLSNYGFTFKYDTNTFYGTNTDFENESGSDPRKEGSIRYYFSQINSSQKTKEETKINLMIKNNAKPGVYKFEMESLGIGSICKSDGLIYPGEPKFNIGNVTISSASALSTTTPAPTASTATVGGKAENNVVQSNSNYSESNKSEISNTNATQAPTPTATIINTATPTLIQPEKIEQDNQKPAAQYKFIDIKGHWAEEIMLKLSEKGVINGYKDHSIKPDKYISRNEAVVILVKALNLEPDSDPDLLFSDSDLIPTWVKPYLGVASDYGFIKGYNDFSFKGQNYLTRAEASTIIIKILSILNDKSDFKTNESSKKNSFEGISRYSDFKKSHWASSYLEISFNSGIIKGYPDNTLKPDNNVTRAEFCKMASCLLKEF